MTSVGLRFFSTVSLVTTHLVTSPRDGSSNCTSSRISSRIERSPRAPVSRSSARSAIEPSASSAKCSSMPSKLKKRWNCLTSALRGSLQDADQVVARELVDRRDHGQAADELRDQPVVHEVLGQHLLEHLAGVLVLVRVDRPRRSPRRWLPMRRSITLSRSANAPPQMNRMFVVSIVRNSWCGCLRPPCGGTDAKRALEDLQQRLLHALAGHVARDRRVVGLARDLVDLVDVDDPGLGLLDVEVGGLDQLQQDVLDVLADVAGLGQRRRVGDRERHVQDARQRLREQRLAAAGRAQQQDVRLLQLDLGVLLGARDLDALVVVVDGDRQRALGLLLADDVLVQDRVDLLRLGQALDVERREWR